MRLKTSGETEGESEILDTNDSTDEENNNTTDQEEEKDIQNEITHNSDEVDDTQHDLDDSESFEDEDNNAAPVEADVPKRSGRESKQIQKLQIESLHSKGNSPY